MGALVVASTVWGAHVLGTDDGMSVVSVYCVFASTEEAERIGRTVVEEGLAACINILAPCRSIYRWQGAIETAEEAPAILKTSAEAAEALISRIAGLHSYERAVHRRLADRQIARSAMPNGSSRASARLGNA